MSLGRAVVACYRRYATFGGRARRSEFWWFHLYALLVWVPTAVAATVLWGNAFEGSISGPAEDPTINPDAVAWAPLTVALGVILLYLLAVGMPLLAVTARRLHDIDRSAWWLLLQAAGLGVVLLVMGVFQGRTGSNRYGPDPRLVAAPVLP
ncbi:DUF805 domain-containing protein [Demequina sp.]|uniref:DUF805 domain-containing protein n=1 Tax=Demequina sp. TaxID=2050685 RepID=UPI0025ECEFF2|nr:DUF805 domain-containing protein [Demequina sp.]